jgi:CDK inhibitor PHO81
LCVRLANVISVQPVFNRDVIAALSDTAASGLLELEAWINGEEFFGSRDAVDDADHISRGSGNQNTLPNLESELFTALSHSDMSSAESLRAKLAAYSEEDQKSILTTAFLRTIAEGAIDSVQFLLDTGQVDTSRNDEITDRGCLHEAAIAGRLDILRLCVEHGYSLQRTQLTR